MTPFYIFRIVLLAAAAILILLAAIWRNKKAHTLRAVLCGAGTVLCVMVVLLGFLH
jgi:hypothetical protein